MVFEPAIRIIVLTLALGTQIYLRSFWFRRATTAADLNNRSNLIKHLAKWSFVALSILGVSALGWRTWLQYQAWQAHPFDRFLLSPHTPWSYFIEYVGWRFFAPLFIAVLVGVFCAFAAQALNRRYEERFFELEEPFFLAIAILCVGYPTFLFYILILFLIGIFWSAGYQLIKQARAPLYYFWFPVAILAILITWRYVPLELLSGFNF